MKGCHEDCYKNKWLCEKHFKEWATSGNGKNEIVSVKEVKNGMAAKKFGDNPNPNLINKLNKIISTGGVCPLFFFSKNKKRKIKIF